MIKKIIYQLILKFLNNILGFLMIYWFIKYSYFDKLYFFFFLFTDAIFCLTLDHNRVEFYLFIILYYIYYKLFSLLTLHYIIYYKHAKKLIFILYNILLYNFLFLDYLYFIKSLSLISYKDVVEIYILFYYYSVYKMLRFYSSYCLQNFEYSVLYFYFIISVFFLIKIVNPLLFNTFCLILFVDSFYFFFRYFSVVWFLLWNFLFVFLFLVLLIADYRLSEGEELMEYFKLLFIATYYFTWKFLWLIGLYYYSNIFKLIFFYYLYILLLFYITQYIKYIYTFFYYEYELDLFLHIYILITLNYIIINPLVFFLFFKVVWPVCVNKIIFLLAEYYTILNFIGIFFVLLLNLNLTFLNYMFVKNFLKYLYLQRGPFFLFYYHLKFVIKLFLVLFDKAKIVYYLKQAYLYFVIFDRFVYDNKSNIYIATIILIHINFFNPFKQNMMNISIYYLFFN